MEKKQLEKEGVLPKCSSKPGDAEFILAPAWLQPGSSISPQLSPRLETHKLWELCGRHPEVD